MQYIFLNAFIILTINILYFIDHINRDKMKRTTPLIAKSGDYKGQTHDIKDWRKIAIELAKNSKVSRLNAMAKYGTDEDVIGLLYTNFGIELDDID